MKTWHWIIIAVLLAIVILYLSKNKIKAAMTRGYKNNNPGNIEDVDGKVWIGQKPKTTDPPFKQFQSMPYGYRALWLDIRSKLAAGYNTLATLITRYAPPKENNTVAYITDMSKKVGKLPNDRLVFTDTATIRKLVAAISQHEQGIPANMDDVDAGYKLLKI